MRPLKKIMRKPLANPDGFTMMELMVVFAIIGILAVIASRSYMLARARAMDSQAHSVARNLVSTVVNSIMDKEDVDYNKANTGGPIGAFESDGVTPRTPIFVLPPGVQAFITGSSSVFPHWQAEFTGFIYHTGGTDAGGATTNPLGKKEYLIEVNEDTGEITAPGY